MHLAVVAFSFFISASASAEVIACKSNKDGSLSVTVAKPHPNQMGVSTPDNDFFWLQGDGALRPLFSASHFASVTDFNITTGTIGTVYREGNATQEIVLSKSGVYTLYISENLETEQDNTLSFRCDFIYE